MLDLTLHTTEKKSWLEARAIAHLQRLVRAVPELGDPVTFLKHDFSAQDAVYTLTALKVDPTDIAIRVAHTRFTERTALAIIAAAATRRIINLLKGI